MKFKLIIILICTLYLSACQYQKTITVLFETNGGFPIEEITLNDQNNHQALPIPEKENYLFVGWFLDAEFNIPINTFNVDHSIFEQEVVTLYAKWERAFYTLTKNIYIELELMLIEINDHIVNVVLGENHTMILTEQGRVFTWGDNQYGQLGNGNTTLSSIPKDITETFSLHEFEKIDYITSGWGHSAALTSLNRLFVWGRNDSGQLGNGTTNDQHTPQDITPLFLLAQAETFHQVVLGWGHSAALTSSGRLFMWGKNESGQLGDGSNQNTNIPLDITASLRRTIQDPIHMIALGSSHSGLLTTTGSLFTWGRNVYGQLGDGTTNSTSRPKEITQNMTLQDQEVISNISLGWGHSAVQTSLNRVFTWGFNQFGQLGNQTNDDQLRPIVLLTNNLLENNAVIQQLKLGNGHSSLLTSNQQLFTWGFNQFGQLGNNTTINENKPTNIPIQLAPTETIKALSLGVNHSAVLTSTSRLILWGFNQYGQLGNGTTINKINTQYETFHVLETTQITQVAAPFILPIPPAENMIWYDRLSFLQPITFPLTLTSDMTIYAKRSKP